MAIVLGANQFGKAEVRLVRLVRDTPRHEITDLNVTSQLFGDFDVAFLEGDNAPIITTDAQKNAVYGFAREHGVASPEAFLLLLADHFSGFPMVTGGRWSADSYGWDRIEDHDHAFVRAGETRTAAVVREGGHTFVLAGLKDLVVLKSTGSEFHGFVRERFTTLAETDDRILATSVAARWRYLTTEVDFDTTYAEVKALLLRTFAGLHSLALQQTLFEMGRAALEAFPEIAEIRFSTPNKHHFLVDLSPFGLENPGEVFYAADRPYGLIEAEVRRDDVPAAPTAWDGIGGFC